MTGNSRHNGLAGGGIDWVAVLIYIALTAIGWLNIYAASYDPAAGGVFDLAHRSTMQLIWLGISFFVAIAILLIDDKFYHLLAYPLYWLAIIVLVAVLFLGKEVNGARSWIVFGPVALQPTELVKFTTALAVARYMSNYDFSIRRLSSVLAVGLFLALPFGIIMVQNDTGSALVYGSFLFMLYREGLNSDFYVALLMAVGLFIFSFLLTPFTILVALIVLCVVGEGMANGRWRAKAVFVAALALATILLYFGLTLVAGKDVTAYGCLLASSLLSIPFVFVYAYRNKIRRIYRYVLLFVGSLVFAFTVDYVFDNVLQVHQQKRILDLLGLESDLKGWGYNVNQSKIAIGSGGFFGKGFLNGTQTKYNFVPEQSTDFIFCTVGEEWGFVGTMVVVVLFAMMILRLMRMGERQGEAFGRIYCYSVAGIFFFHTLINIGMTIGLMPVIGIPLPFFSYGGSSLLAFTILYFVAVRFDAKKN